MHGLIGRIRAQPGQRDALVSILLESTSSMPGCISYIVALDSRDDDGIWVTEVWRDEASHKASLQMPEVIDAISRGKPLIAEFDQYYETVPVGGHGL
jgi:quinol monooxygenase YgiN